MSIAALDVHYFNGGARAACVLFNAWGDAVPCDEHVVAVPAAADYVSGRFYLRELPCLLAVLRRAPAQPDAVVIDAYVWLDRNRSPGLGAHLWDALGRRCPVIGVAKNPRKGPPDARAITRGKSAKPLFVSAAGVPAEEAARLVRAMHGEYRIPDLLRRVDQLARGMTRATQKGG